MWGVVCLLCVPACVGKIGQDDPSLAGPSASEHTNASSSLSETEAEKTKKQTDPLSYFYHAEAETQAETQEPASPPSPCAGFACNGETFCSASTGAATCLSSLTSDLELRSREAVCDRWKTRLPLQSRTQPIWTGSLDACQTSGFADRTLTVSDYLRHLNVYRWLAGVPSTVVEDTTHSDVNQACAVIMAANFSATHQPPAHYKCMPQIGAQVAASAIRSNIAFLLSSPSDPYLLASDAIKGWMNDFGRDNINVGHRRWLLSQKLTKVGFGFAAGAWNNPTYPNWREAMVCSDVFDNSGSTVRVWTSYPNPGYAPIETAMNDLNADERRWSFHSPVLSLSGAKVTLIDISNNTSLPVKTLYPSNAYGEPAVVWVPQGWTATAGQSIRVTIEPSSGTTITYVVRFTKC